MRGKGMAEGVRRNIFLNAGSFRIFFYLLPDKFASESFSAFANKKMTNINKKKANKDKKIVFILK